MGFDRKREAPTLATASWFTDLPAGYVRIGISRGPFPKHIDLNTMRYQALIPNQSSGDDVPPELFHRNYLQRLAALDPEFVREDILRMAGRRVPVLCSWTHLPTILSGRRGCHRHLIAAWFERALDMKVPEIGAPPAADRYVWWRLHPPAISVPGDRPRTGPQPRPSPMQKAVRRLAQGSFKF